MSDTEAFVEYLTAGVSVNGSPITRESFWSKISFLTSNTSSSTLHRSQTSFESLEEWLFTTFNNLASIAFQALSKQNKQVQEEKRRLDEKCRELQLKCTSLRCEVKDLNQKLEKTASQKSQEEFKLQIKYRDLEDKMKKCASIINSTFFDGGVMGQVRDIITQSIPTDEDTIDSPVPIKKVSKKRCNNVKKNSNDFKQPESIRKNQPVLCLDEEDTSILAPSSPDHSDVEQTITDQTKVIPETVPFDLVPKRGRGENGLRNVLAPVQKSKYNSSPKKRTPNKAPTILDNENSQDLAMTYSPPIIADFGSPRAMALNQLDQQRKQATPRKDLFLSTPTKAKGALKQTKITLGTTRSGSQTAAARVATKAVRASPCKQESKRRRKGKDPEDWACKECYRLFREAEAANKIDVRKLPVSMNFCPEHRNRYTYYLNTPPGFWDCGIGRSPRNGHLHPLDASAIDDDDDFVQ